MDIIQCGKDYHVSVFSFNGRISLKDSHGYIYRSGKQVTIVILLAILYTPIVNDLFVSIMSTVCVLNTVNRQKKKII